LSADQAWRPDAVKARAKAYERLRSDLAAPAPLTAPSVATDAQLNATEPDTLPVQSGFANTYPGAPTGFDATRPYLPEDDRSTLAKGR
jgi:hypothetical protein